jgi:SUMO ligase MMS21 Smc5/6 complex component
VTEVVSRNRKNCIKDYKVPLRISSSMTFLIFALVFFLFYNVLRKLPGSSCRR